MADQLDDVAAAARGRRGGVAAAARGRRGGGGPRLYPLEPNKNHGRPLIGRSKEKMQDDIEIQLTKSHRVENEDINVENEKLVQIYNNLTSIGRQYSRVGNSSDEKKTWLTNELRRLRGNFMAVLKKIKPQEAAIRRIGGEPMPFPGPAMRMLPAAFQRLMKCLK